MGVYSGVYEYTQQIQEQIRSIQSIQVFVHLLSCRQDPCSIIYISLALWLTLEQLSITPSGKLVRKEMFRSTFPQNYDFKQEMNFTQNQKVKKCLNEY